MIDDQGMRKEVERGFGMVVSGIWYGMGIGFGLG